MNSSERPQRAAICWGVKCFSNSRVLSITCLARAKKLTRKGPFLSVDTKLVLVQVMRIAIRGGHLGRGSCWQRGTLQLASGECMWEYASQDLNGCRDGR